MDDLTFRRRVFEDPDTTDKELLEAASRDPEKRQFLHQTRLLNQQLKEAVKVPVPDSLAHKLIWQQRTEQFQQHKTKQRWSTGLAASFAIVISICATMWVMQPSVQLQDQAMAHVTHLSKEIPQADYQINIDEVNAKLASFGGRLNNTIGEIKVANFCHLQQIRSLHLILDSPSGKLSVFVIAPDAEQRISGEFENQHYQGRSFRLQNARILVVGDKGSDLAPLTRTLKKNMQFSA